MMKILHLCQMSTVSLIQIKLQKEPVYSIKKLKDGTEEGECSFSVHGLTGEALDTTSTNAIKAHALHNLNSGGKILAVGHSNKFESMWNKPQLYPQMFPWLFLYGLGGIGTTNLSDKEHK